MDTDLLERAFVTVVTRMIDDKKLEPRIRNQSDFARLAFPVGGAVNKWKNLRCGSGNGKPKSLTLSEAIQMARALEMPLSALLTRAEILIEEGFTFEDDVFNKKKSVEKPDTSDTDTPINPEKKTNDDDRPSPMA